MRRVNEHVHEHWLSEPFPALSTRRHRHDAQPASETAQCRAKQGSMDSEYTYDWRSIGGPESCPQPGSVNELAASLKLCSSHTYAEARSGTQNINNQKGSGCSLRSRRRSEPRPARSEPSPGDWRSPSPGPANLVANGRYLIC